MRGPKERLQRPTGSAGLMGEEKHRGSSSGERSPDKSEEEASLGQRLKNEKGK